MSRKRKARADEHRIEDSDHAITADTRAEHVEDKGMADSYVLVSDMTEQSSSALFHPVHRYRNREASM